MRIKILALATATGLFLAACSTSATTGGGAPAAGSTPAAAGGAVQFMSTQYNTVDETTKVNNTILKGSPVSVQFQPSELGAFNDRVTAEEKSGKVTVGVI